MEQDSSIVTLEHATVLSELVSFFAASAGAEDLPAELVRRAHAALPYERCTLALLDSARQVYDVRNLAEMRPNVPPALAATVAVDQDSVSVVLVSGQACQLTGDAVVPSQPLLSADPAMWDGSLAAILCLPLLAREMVIGALILGTTRPTGFDAGEVTFATSVAALIAAAIDRRQQSDEWGSIRRDLVYLASFPELNPSAIIEVDLAGQVHL